MYLGIKHSARVHTRLRPKQPVYTLKSLEKIEKQELTPFNFPWNRMYVHWREREHKDINILVEEDPSTIVALCNDPA
jgi:hypothetical protein